LRNIFHIAVKEFKAFFISPIGYVVAGIFLLLSGWNIINRIMLYQSRSLSFHKFKATKSAAQMAANLNIDVGLIQPILGFSSLLILFLFPAITMKLFAEEKRSGSFELLLTSPISLIEIIMGKFLGALLFVFSLLTFSFSIIGLLFVWSTPELPTALCGLLGIFLFSASIVAFGIFASTLTDSQIIAFFLGFGGSLFFYILNWISYNTTSSLGEVASYLSLLPHLMSFIRGIFSTADFMFYVSFIGLFLYLSYQKLDMARWR
jgi:ABC-2 type transport system permease protein